MSDNLVIKDGVGAPKTLATQESGGVHTPKHIVIDSALPAGASTAANQTAVLAGLGPTNETAYAGTGAKGLNGLLKGIFTLLSGKLSIQPSFAASGVSAVTSTFTAGSTQSAGFTPIAGRPFNVTLSGTWAGTVQLERSFDGGTSYVPLTANGYPLYIFTGNCSETMEECEVGVSYRLNCTAFSSGPISYRISQ